MFVIHLLPHLPNLAHFTRHLHAAERPVWESPSIHAWMSFRLPIAYLTPFRR